ncbi:hypothetical protein [uncultured Methanobrevibacter sp.]|uniref:hypothetical protein n=1 Tax=uncultured Methanobrevibacter sp. TaxID=253161 RepID=UPI0025D4F5EC|nr:hypothetical protein [uncultured Methanobrevibacter sp.]
MLEEEYLQVSKELSSLKYKRNELERKLELPQSREDIIEYKYDLIKINEKIRDLDDELHILEKKIQIEKEKKLEEEKKQKQKELHYKEFYILLTENMHIFNKFFKITQWNNEKSVRYLLENYTEQQLYEILNLFNFLDSQVFDNFINDFHTDNTPFNSLLNKYEDKCKSIENLKPGIKNIIKNVENKHDLKFDGIDRGYSPQVIFIKDYSKEVNFQSFLLKNFEDFVYGDIEVYCDVNGIDFDWEKMSEYDKLDLISITSFCEWYCDELYNEIKGIIGDEFDYYVDIKLPNNPNPITLQTTEYQNWKNKVYEKNIKKYEEAIARKKSEIKRHQ